jgi:uncharacterized RDD family membrane protein YckC
VTRADEQPAPAGGYPWHEAPAPQQSARRDGISGNRAGLVTRATANVVDAVLVLAVLGAIWLAVAAVQFLLNPTGFRFPSPPAWTLLLGLVLQALYFAVAWAVVGATYGDLLLGLSVTGRRGERLHWGLATVRAAFCAFVPIGLLWVLVSRENRSVQDLLLRTSVVYD